jgi:hypothetical protein
MTTSLRSLSAALVLGLTLLAACSAPPPVTCDLSHATPVVHATLTGSEHWDAGVHEVTAALALKGAGATLTIEPCSEVRLAKDVGLAFSDGAALVAQGTQAQPIRFVRRASAEAWGALSVSAPATASLAFVTLEGGGGTTPKESADFAAATLVARGPGTEPATVLTVKDVAVKGSTGLGVMMLQARFDPASSNLAVTGSGWFPVYTGANVGDLPSGSYTGNAVDEVLLQSIKVAVYGNEQPILGDVTLRDRGVPYRVGLDGANIVVGDGREGSPEGRLTLEAGVTVRFSTRAGFAGKLLVQGIVKSGGAVAPQGALIAVGTAEKPVTLTSGAATPAAGDWMGLYFARAVHAATTIDHAVIEYAGGDSGSVGVCKASNGATNYDADCSVIVFLEGDLGVPRFLGNTRIAHGLACGVYRGWHGTDVDFRATNTFADLTGCSQSNVPPTGQVCDATPCPNP